MDVIDYGAGITAEELAKKVEEDEIEIILISALMLRAALKVKDFMAIIKEKNPSVKVIVGGAPFNLDKTLLNSVGADAYAADAVETLNYIRKYSGGL